MVRQLHLKAKEKINMVYIRPSGTEGYCYLDPSLPLRWKTNYNSFPRLIEHNHPENVDSHLIGVYKQVTGVEIFVEPKNLRIHSKQKAMVMEILYGSK